MYLDKVYSKNIDIQKTLTDPQDKIYGSDIFHAFENNEYTFFVTYKNEIIQYYAILINKNNNALPKLLIFSIDINGELLGVPSQEELAFCLYLIKKEEENEVNNPEKVEKQYDFLPQSFKELSKYSPSELKLRSQVRDDFASLLDEFKDAKNFVDTEITTFGNIVCEIEIINGLNPKDYSNRLFKIRVGSPGSLYVVKNIKFFLKSIYENQRVTLGKNFDYVLSSSLFTEKALQILDFFEKKSRQSYDYNTCELDDRDFVTLLDLLKDETIKYDEKYFKVTDKEKGSIDIDDLGNFTIFPEITIPQKKSDSFSYKSTFIFFDHANKCLRTIEFKNAASFKFYDFLNKYKKSFKSEYISDLISENFKKQLPHIVEYSKNPNVESKFRIEYFISLDTQKNPVFDVKYFYDGNEVKADLVRDDFNVSFKLTKFENLVNSIPLLLKGRGNNETLAMILITDFSIFRDIATVYIDKGIKDITLNKSVSISINVQYVSGWLDVKVGSEDYNNKEINDILNSYKKKKKFILINNKLIDLRENTEVKKLNELQTELAFKEDNFNNKIPFYQSLKLQKYIDINEENKDKFNVEFDSKIRDIFDQIKDFKNADVYINPSLQNTLRPYQIEGIKWLGTIYNTGFSGILGDDMGLGKTLEIISLIDSLETELPIIIVCPKSLIYNWKAEFKKWAPHLKTVVIDGNRTHRMIKINDIKKGSKVSYITSYDSLRTDIDFYYIKEFSLAIVDEAQHIKNASAEKTKAVKQLRAEGKFALTGTPIENSLLDLWSIFDFLMPKYLNSRQKFTEEYLTAFNPGSSNAEAKKKLLAKVTPFILRRTKEQVLTELPPKTELITTIDLTDKQKELYEAYRQKAVNSFTDFKAQKMSILATINRLRQIAVDPSSFLENYDEIAAKLDYSLELIQESIENGHKVLVFSFFTSVLTHLKDLLQKLGIKSYYLSGDTPAEERFKMSNDFNTSDNIKVFLVSLKAGGTGLNLIGADTVIHLDPWWNVAAENQATDRAHRIGQTRPVTIYKLVSYNTVEDKIIKLQERKKALYDQVIRNGGDFISSMDDEDFKYLLSN